MNEPVQFEFAMGQRVMLPTSDIGTVVARCEKEFGKSYLVVWWCDGQRREEWCFAFEIRSMS